MPGEAELGISGGSGPRGQIWSWGGREVSLSMTAAPSHKATPPTEEMAHNLSIVCPGQAGSGCEQFLLPGGCWCHLVPLPICGAFSCVEGKAGPLGRPMTL